MENRTSFTSARLNMPFVLSAMQSIPCLIVAALSGYGAKDIHIINSTEKI